MEKGIERLETGVGSCGEQTGATHLPKVSRRGAQNYTRENALLQSPRWSLEHPRPRPQGVQIHTHRKKPEP